MSKYLVKTHLWFTAEVDAPTQEAAQYKVKQLGANFKGHAYGTDSVRLLNCGVATNRKVKKVIVPHDKP